MQHPFRRTQTLPTQRRTRPLSGGGGTRAVGPHVSGSTALDALRVWLDAGVAGGAEPPEGVHPEIQATAHGILTWASSSEDALPESVLDSFRDLALAYRYHGFSVMDTLEHVADLEDVLSAESPKAALKGPEAGARLRRAVRALVAEVVRLNRRLDLRRHREQSDALEAFSEILTHELGNRLGAARTGVEILTALSSEATAGRRESLTELISESIDAALETVDDVARIMSTHAHPDHDMKPLTDVARGVARSVHPVARRMGVRVEVVEPLPEVLVDGGRMRLVLSNLFLNGARYADADKEERFVRLSAVVGEGTLRLEVRDNGVGIEEAERERIFHPYQRGRLAEDQARGSGLGLAIVREAAAQMHGGIELESEPGVGSVFRLQVPLPRRGAVRSSTG